MGVGRVLFVVGALCSAIVVASSSGQPAAASTDDVGTVVPARLLDTRSNGDTIDGLFQGAGKVGAGTFTQVQITGRGGVPIDAVGVELNITAIQNEGRGFATLYPCTPTPPTASTLNYTPGVNIANATTVALNSSGEVSTHPPPLTTPTASLRWTTSPVITASSRSGKLLNRGFATSSHLPSR